MKATFDRQALLNAAQLAAPAAAKKTVKPILQCLYLKVAEDEATLTARDVEISVTATIKGANCSRPGEAILLTDRVLSALKLADKESSVVVMADDDQVAINTSGSNFKFAASDPALYPSPQRFDAEDYFSVSAADLRLALRRTVFATQGESLHFALGGVLFEFEDENLICVATDGRRMGLQEIRVETEGNPVLPGSIVIPAKACNLLARLLKDEDPPAHIAFRDNSALVRTEDAVVVAQLLAGRFPAWRRILPEKIKSAVPFDVATLRTRLEQASLTTSVESSAVDLALDRGQLVISSQSQDVGSSRAQMVLDFDGEPVSVMLTPGYLIDALKVLPDDAPASILVQGENTSVLIETQDGYTYLAMPMSREVK